MRNHRIDDYILQKFLSEGFKCTEKCCRCYCHSYEFGEFCLKLCAGMHILSKQYIEMLLTLKEAVKAKPNSRSTRKYCLGKKISIR